MTADPSEIQTSSLLDTIQTDLRLPLPNLVYRRLAAEQPTFLAAAWPLSRPVAGSAWLVAAGEAVADAARAGATALAPLPTPPGALQVLDGFGRMNPPNLVILHAWLAALRGEPPHGTDTPLEPRRDERPAPLPPMLPTDAHPLMAEIAAANGGQYPSVWRILANWPNYLPRAWAATVAHHKEGRVRGGAAEVDARARQYAAAFPVSLAGLREQVPDAEVPRTIALLAAFAEELLPRIITELALLRARATT